ncbi:MAG: helix-turn-helix domain-containing protein [Sphaerochaeta sp.]
MKEIDSLLNMIENPTRRRILEALVREPHYPFQLARELKVSQPAIAKHLRVLEEGGLVHSKEERSERGPARRVYHPKAGFTFMAELRDGVFRTRVIPEADSLTHELGMEESSLHKAREEMRRLDRSIEEMEQMWAQMMEQRSRMASQMFHRLRDEEDAYRHRQLLQRLLDFPQHDLEQVSRSLEMRREECERLLGDLEKMVGGEDSEK